MDIVLSEINIPLQEPFFIIYKETWEEVKPGLYGWSKLNETNAQD